MKMTHVILDYIRKAGCRKKKKLVFNERREDQKGTKDKCKNEKGVMPVTKRRTEDSSSDNEHY